MNGGEAEVMNGGEATENQNPSMTTAAYKKFQDRMRRRRRRNQRINNKPPQSVKENGAIHKTEKLYTETVPSLAEEFDEQIVSSLCFYPAAYAFAHTFSLLNMPTPEKLYTETVSSLALRAYEQAAMPPIPSPYFYPGAFGDLNMHKVDMGSGAIIPPIKYEDVDPCEEQQRS